MFSILLQGEIVISAKFNLLSANASRPVMSKSFLFGNGLKTLLVYFWQVLLFYPFHKRQILDSSKLKEFADDNFKIDENGRKFSKWVENTVGKEEIASMFSKNLYDRHVKAMAFLGKG